MSILTLILRIIFGVFFAYAGFMHFKKPNFFNGFIPNFLPKLAVNYVFGFIEFILGIGLFFNQTVKKRVDKAFIKGTTERVTQKGKISIIYSQKEDEIEYLRYINFLQSKSILDKDLEIFELQDLQGVTGLKALRVSLLYNDKKDKKFYTYSDLMTTLKN